MPKFRYFDAEPRDFPHIPVELDDETGEPSAFLSALLAEGDVIEAVSNPDETRFEDAPDDAEIHIASRVEVEVVVEVEKPKRRRRKETGDQGDGDQGDGSGDTPPGE